MTDGVPVTELCCPTCGAEMDITEVKYDEEYDIMQTHALIHTAGLGQPYLRCVNHHAWTIKTVTRLERVDAVLLGYYLGER